MPDVIMQYDLMRKMTKTFTEAAELLENDLRNLRMIGGSIEGGVLLGNVGHKLVDHIEEDLVPYTDMMLKKMQELAGDVEGARAFMEEGDDTAASRFK